MMPTAVPVEALAWSSIRDIGNALHCGELAADGVVRSHLERIARLDGLLHSYIYVDPDARASATGVLAGCTVAVKDTQPVRGMPWTWATRRWRDQVADFDTPPVERLRRGGAAMLGKTNLPELAASVGTTNELFPPTENPWRPGLSPGGSSGGSAVAVAAGLTTIASGDDSGGSIRIPAACCGVVGLRPSPGRVPLDVLDPSGLAVRGPLARSVDDVRIAFSVMSGLEPSTSPAGREPEAAQRVAVVRTSALPVEAAQGDACARAAEHFRSSGAVLTEIEWDPRTVAEAYRTVRAVGLGAFPGEAQEYGAEVARLMDLGRAASAVDYYRALRRGLTAARRMCAPLLDGSCTILVTPTLGMAPRPIPDVPGFLGPSWDVYTQFVLPVSFAGLPAVTIPAGVTDGIPVGVQLVGRPGRDLELLDVAERLECAAGFGFQRPPGY